MKPTGEFCKIHPSLTVGTLWVAARQSSTLNSLIVYFSERLLLSVETVRKLQLMYTKGDTILVSKEKVSLQELRDSTVWRIGA
jgi:hypothetical protein